ncbi:hypothetical protein DW683_10035 [Bacteroides sp. AM25-34]|nr:hypothetical protein DW683_10035 [Bacteroides sp. AM25-34]
MRFFLYEYPKKRVGYRSYVDIKKRLSSQTANLFVNLKSNTMKNTLQIYGHLLKIQVLESNQCVL